MAVTVRSVTQRVTTLMILGASGDLSSRLLLPALGQLLTSQPQREVHLVGSGTNPIDKSYILGFNGRTVIKRSDFGVTTHIPLIGDDTEIRVSIAFVKKPA